jgi:hypothetical protein
LPFPFEPSLIGVEWSGLQVAADALFQRKQGVPEAVIVKGGVSFEHSPRLFDRLPQQFSPSRVLSFLHLVPSFFLFSSVISA